MEKTEKRDDHVTLEDLIEELKVEGINLDLIDFVNIGKETELKEF